MSNILKKPWISPFVAITYLVVAVTGLMMMFHFKNGTIFNLHQWLGIFCLVATIFHLANNWRVFTAYFQNKKWFAPVIAAIILALVFGLVGLNSSDGRKGAGRYQHSFLIQDMTEQGRPIVESIFKNSNQV